MRTAPARPMKFVFFYHSLRSDWNHGNAHFLRGVVSELRHRGHDVVVYEPKEGWSLTELIRDQGPAGLDAFHRAYPRLDSRTYRLARLDLDRALENADVAIVHEWNDPALIERLGSARAERPDLRLLFHDTHHRAVTSPRAMAEFDLTHVDGVLAFGRVIRDHYLERGWARAAFTWHEAADTRVFHPRIGIDPSGDLVWIGNWGDDDRARELQEFLIEPARDLALRTVVYGVRYPERAIQQLEAAGIHYGGWLPNADVPATFARFALTVHVPRRSYARALPGIPTIRMFEALACGIPLVCAPWDDCESLFTPGADYFVARDGHHMKHWLKLLRGEPDYAREIAAHGFATLRARHTCVHRVDELFGILKELGARGVETAANGTPSRAAGSAKERV